MAGIRTGQLQKRLKTTFAKRLPRRTVVLLRVIRRPVRSYRRLKYDRHGFRKIARRGIAITADVVQQDAYQRRYQPLLGIDDSEAAARRPPQERWRLIEPHLPKAGAALDLGTQHGWFALKLAGRGIYCLGIDNDEANIRVLQWLVLHNNPEGVAFMKADLGPSTVRCLPAVDVVLCLSLFHHWVAREGLESARKTMQGLAERCRDRLFFETGQPDEVGQDWTAAMEFMRQDPKAWMAEFLLSLGFSHVDYLGETASYDNRSSRHLFMAKR